MTNRREVPAFSARPHIWLEPAEPLVCPRGHKLHTNAVTLDESLESHAAFTCQYKQPGTPSPNFSAGTRAQFIECGAMVYVLRLPGGIRYVAEVTQAEMRLMLAQNMKLVQVLNFLTKQHPPTNGR